MCEYKARYLHLHVLWIILSYLGVFSIVFTSCCIFIHEKLEIFIGSVSSASSVVFKGTADLDKYWSTDQSTHD